MKKQLAVFLATNAVCCLWVVLAYAQGTNRWVVEDTSGKKVAEGELKSTPGPQGQTVSIYDVDNGVKKEIPRDSISRIDQSSRRGQGGCEKRPIATFILKAGKISGCFTYSMWIEDSDGIKTNLDDAERDLVLRKKNTR